MTIQRPKCFVENSWNSLMEGTSVAVKESYDRGKGSKRAIFYFLFYTQSDTYRVFFLIFFLLRTLFFFFFFLQNDEHRCERKSRAYKRREVAHMVIRQMKRRQDVTLRGLWPFPLVSSTMFQRECTKQRLMKMAATHSAFVNWSGRNFDCARGEAS